jgi:hypothetical protein
MTALLNLCEAAVWQGFIAANAVLLLEVFWLMAEAAAVQRPDQHVPWSTHDICDEWVHLLGNLSRLVTSGGSICGMKLHSNS